MNQSSLQDFVCLLLTLDKGFTDAKDPDLETGVSLFKSSSARLWSTNWEDNPVSREHACVLFAYWASITASLNRQKIPKRALCEAFGFEITFRCFFVWIYKSLILVNQSFT